MVREPLIRLFDFLRGSHTVKNTAISPDFLVCKFCGKAQFPHSFGRNYAFPQNFHTRKSGEITVFFAVSGNMKIVKVGKFQVISVFKKITFKKKACIELESVQPQ